MPAMLAIRPPGRSTRRRGVSWARRAAHAATTATTAVIALAVTAAAGPGVTHQPAPPGQTVASYCAELCSSTPQSGLARLPGAV
jgi:hypothetical protein